MDQQGETKNILQCMVCWLKVGMESRGAGSCLMWGGHGGIGEPEWLGEQFLKPSEPRPAVSEWPVPIVFVNGMQVC